jgi:hypothetical protein
MTRSYRSSSAAQRDAIRHMLLAGMRPRDVAHDIEIDPRRAEIRLRRPSATAAKLARITEVRK